MPKVSVIIPIYNAEKYIRRCLDSVCGSELSDIEIICVDDGSRDRSGITCDEYSRKDTRIRVIHKKNGGPASARNAGIKAASGEYIYFMDADDFVDPEMLYKMVNAAEKNNCEVVICGYKTIPGENRVIPSYVLNKALSPRELILKNHRINRNNDLCFSWRFLFKRKTIEENHIRFSEKVHMGEDTIFNLEALLKSNYAYVLDEALYNYTIDNSDSIMKKPYKKHMEENLRMQYEIRRKLARESGLDKSEAFMEDMALYYIDSILKVMISNVLSGPEEDKKAAIKRILNYEMFKESTAQIGLNYKYNKLKEFIFYLAVKYRLAGIVCLGTRYPSKFADGD